jgi:hypothetical protein
VLCDNPNDGGAGFTPEEVGRMTLDQVMMRMTDRSILLNRTERTHPDNLVARADPQRQMRGIDGDGKPIKARIAGKSKARQLMEAAAARKKLEADKQPPKLSPREQKLLK